MHQPHLTSNIPRAEASDPNAVIGESLARNVGEGNHTAKIDRIVADVLLGWTTVSVMLLIQSCNILTLALP
jgi:hypothetical protein